MGIEVGIRNFGRANFNGSQVSAGVLHILKMSSKLRNFVL